MKRIRALVLYALIAVGCESDRDIPPPVMPETITVPDDKIVSEKEIWSYASREYDRKKMELKTVQLGRNNGQMVIAEHPCSDQCPKHTIRVVRYDLGQIENCASVGGVSRIIRVPRSAAVVPARYCFPRILVENWQEYANLNLVFEGETAYRDIMLKDIQSDSKPPRAYWLLSPSGEGSK
jgi:hypothetical protein